MVRLISSCQTVSSFVILFINRMVNIITLVALVSSTKMVTLYSMYRKKVLQKQKLNSVISHQLEKWLLAWLMLVEDCNTLMKMASKLKVLSMLLQTENSTSSIKIQVMPTQIVGLKSMVSGMNSMIKAMHKLRRVNSTQQMAQHGSTVMQLVKMWQVPLLWMVTNTTSVQMVPKLKVNLLLKMARLATTL